MKANQARSDADKHNQIRNHDNGKLVTSLVAAIRVAEQNSTIPLMSDEFYNMNRFGESIVSEILLKRNIGDAGRFGYQQVKYRNIFITETDKAKFEKDKDTLSYAQLLREGPQIKRPGVSPEL